MQSEKWKIQIAKVNIAAILATAITVIAAGCSTGEYAEPEYGSLDYKLLRFVESSELDDIKNVKALIDKGANIHAKDRFGKTPLHWAAGLRRPDIVELLIVRGANVNAKDSSGHTPLDEVKGLRWSSEDEQRKVEEVQQLLLRHGGKLGDEFFAYPRLAKTIQICVPITAILVQIFPFFYVVKTGRFRKGVLLTWVLLVSYYVLTALILVDIVAVYERKLARLLPEGPAVVGAFFGGPIWGLIICSVALFIRGRIQRWWPSLLPESANRPPEPWISYLSPRQGEVGLADESCGVTSLHKAASKGDREAVELLINKGEEVNAKDKWGNTPLDIAELHGHKELTTLLRKHGGKAGKEIEQ